MSVILRIARRCSLAGSLFLPIFLFSCSNSSENNSSTFRALDEGLINSNKLITKQNDLLVAGLQGKLGDPLSSVKTKVWYPKAILVKKLAEDMFAYIENMKNNLLAEKSSRNRKAEELYDKLDYFKEELMRVDPEITAEFAKTTVLRTKSFDSLKGSKQDFTKTFFDNASTDAISAMLSKFQNNIKIIENRVERFCLDHCYSNFFDEDYTTYSAIVATNSSYVRAGENIEIVAGVGAFSNRIHPEIIINGRKILINESGMAIAKFRASIKPGKYLVPVELTYTDQEGKKQTIPKTVEYTVAKEPIKHE